MMKRKKLMLMFMVFIAVAFMIPSSAHANLAVPLFVATWPAMIVALVPIIIVESIVFFVVLGLSAWDSVMVISYANVVSTIIGIPVTGFLFGTATGFTGQILHDEVQDWMVPSACLVLLIPYFFASWYIEYKYIAIPMLNEFEPQMVRYGMLISNLTSYAILALLLVVVLLITIRKDLLRVVRKFVFAKIYGYKTFSKKSENKSAKDSKENALVS